MIAVAVYFIAIIASNLSISYFGVWVSPVNSFFLIGLDLSLRDYLHERWQSEGLWIKMLSLVCGAGFASYLINPASGVIATASAVAFVASGLVNTIVYKKLYKWHFLRKSNMSNTAAAAADSLIFPAIAFGVWMPIVVLLQFSAKVGGGFFWSLVINRMRKI